MNALKNVLCPSILAPMSNSVYKEIKNNYRISGHETFPCRYTWLPKAVRGMRENPKLFSDEAAAMVILGVGKNMVRSIRFWSQVAGVTTAGGEGGGHLLTEFGTTLLSEGALDPFLEAIRP